MFEKNENKQKEAIVVTYVNGWYHKRRHYESSFEEWVPRCAVDFRRQRFESKTTSSLKRNLNKQDKHNMV